MYFRLHLNCRLQATGTLSYILYALGSEEDVPCILKASLHFLHFVPICKYAFCHSYYCCFLLSREMRPLQSMKLYCGPLTWPCHSHHGWHHCFTGAYGSSRISALDISGLSNWRGKGASWDLSWGCWYYLYDFMFPCISLEEKAWWILATSVTIMWVQLGLQCCCRTNSGLQSTHFFRVWD